MNLAMNVINTVTIILAGFLAYLQFRAANQHTRQDRTLHLDASIDSLNDSRVLLERALPRKLHEVDAATVRAASPDTGELDVERTLRTFLARLQILSLAVESGLADEDFAFELIGSTVAWYGTAFRPYIDEIRLENRQPLLYGDLVALAARWQIRIELEQSEYEATGLPYFARSRAARRSLKRAVRMRSSDSS